MNVSLEILRTISTISNLPKKVDFGEWFLRNTYNYLYYYQFA